MRLIPRNVSVVDADLGKHPLSLARSLAPERTQPDWGSSWEKIWCGRARLNYFILSREPPRNVRLLWLVNPRKRRKKKEKKNNKYASKICLPTRRGWRFFKSVTWYSPQSRISPSCPAYPGCHTQAAGLNCRESAYLSNRITRKEYGHICLSESDGPHVGCNDT